MFSESNLLHVAIFWFENEIWQAGGTAPPRHQAQTLDHPDTTISLLFYQFNVTHTEPHYSVTGPSLFWAVERAKQAE
jgi:hypothetical protein